MFSGSGFLACPSDSGVLCATRAAFLSCLPSFFPFTFGSGKVDLSAEHAAEGGSWVQRPHVGDSPSARRRTGEPTAKHRGCRAGKRGEPKAGLLFEVIKMCQN